MSEVGEIYPGSFLKSSRQINFRVINHQARYFQGNRVSANMNEESRLFIHPFINSLRVPSTPPSFTLDVDHDSIKKVTIFQRDNMTTNSEELYMLSKRDQEETARCVFDSRDFECIKPD